MERRGGETAQGSDKSPSSSGCWRRPAPQRAWAWCGSGDLTWAPRPSHRGTTLNPGFEDDNTLSLKSMRMPGNNSGLSRGCPCKGRRGHSPSTSTWTSQLGPTCICSSCSQPAERGAPRKSKRVCRKTLIPVFQAHEVDALKSGYWESFVKVCGSPRLARPQNIPVA